MKMLISSSILSGKNSRVVFRDMERLKGVMLKRIVVTPLPFFAGAIRGTPRRGPFPDFPLQLQQIHGAGLGIRQQFMALPHFEWVTGFSGISDYAKTGSH